MPKIDFEPKLDFDQVLIRPKRSELNSRNEVDLTRTFRFKNFPEIKKSLLYLVHEGK